MKNIFNPFLRTLGYVEGGTIYDKDMKTVLATFDGKNLHKGGSTVATVDSHGYVTKGGKLIGTIFGTVAFEGNDEKNIGTPDVGATELEVNGACAALIAKVFKD